MRILHITKKNASGESKLAPRCVKIGTGVSKLVKKRMKTYCKIAYEKNLTQSILYGLCESPNYRRIGRPKIHWRLWEKGSFPALAGERYFLADNNGHDGNIWDKTKLFLAYCL